MLKNLEDELNCTLLIRDGRKLLLTDTGRVVFEGKALLADDFDKIPQRTYIHDYSLRLYL
jgi:DNA-binding transcriptional LysR family regulator